MTNFDNKILTMELNDVSFNNVENAFAYKSDKDLKLSHFLFKTMGYPLFVPLATRTTPLLMKCGLPVVNRLVRKTIFKQFVGGESLSATASLANKLNQYNVNIILDYGIEGKDGNDSFETATKEFINVIKYAATQPKKNKRLGMMFVTECIEFVRPLQKTILQLWLMRKKVGFKILLIG